ncbi:MAG: DUF502 domain-containing protein [bacterium]|nr:DUF502 domain-containing protein [bacterium]
MGTTDDQSEGPTTPPAPIPAPSGPPPTPPPADDFKRLFVRGLAALAPTVLTMAALIWAYELIDRHMGRYVTHGMVLAVAASGPPAFISEDKALELALEYGDTIDEWDERGRRKTVQYKIATHPVLSDPDASEKDRKAAEAARNQALWHVAFSRYKLNLIGFLIAIIAVYFVGLFLASLIGRTVWRLVERFLYRVPVIRAIYPNVKQVTDFLFTGRQLQFSGVVAVQYPRKGIWSMGLVTGPPMKSVQEAAGEELITIFIPSSPTPVTGYVITVPRKEVIELSLTMDEAMRYSISAGVIKPSAEAVPGLPAAPEIED